MNIPGNSQFGLGGGKAQSLATPTKPETRSSKKPKLDTPKKDALMTSPSPSATAIPVKAAEIRNHWEYFAHYTLEQLKQVCKFIYSFLVKTK